MEGSGLRARPRRGPSRDRAIRPDEARGRGLLEAAVAAVTRSRCRHPPDHAALEAGECWLQQIARPDSGLSARTIADYSGPGRSTLTPRRRRSRSHTPASERPPAPARLSPAGGNSASAKKAKSVLHGVIGYAVDNGVLSSDATRQVRTVTSTTAKSGERDHTRAMTRSERDYVIHVTLLAAREPGLNPRTRRKRRATADLIAFLAGTGARIDEARRVRWQDVNLEHGRVYLRGTKSETSDRWLNLPDWLVEQLAARAADGGAEGYLFAAPAQRDPERVWDQSNSA